MDAGDLSPVRARLVELRADADAYAAQLERDLEAIRAARADGTADDEHDPEGPTMSQEWARVSALLVDARAEMARIDDALTRMDAGTYGVCRRCGRPIAPGRLEARPMAELCIDCAA